MSVKIQSGYHEWIFSMKEQPEARFRVGFLQLRVFMFGEAMY